MDTLVSLCFYGLMGFGFLWWMVRTIADNGEYGCLFLLLRVWWCGALLGMMGWALQDMLQRYLSVGFSVERVSDDIFLTAVAKFVAGLIFWSLSERFWDVATEDDEEPVFVSMTRPPE